MKTINSKFLKFSLLAVLHHVVAGRILSSYYLTEGGLTNYLTNG